MILISHRGNTHGCNIRYENEPSYVEDAAKIADFVEVDVWYKDFQFYTGHDAPTYKVTADWLLDNKLILHSKDAASFVKLNSLLNTTEWFEKADLFCHDKEPYTYTKNGLVWCYPGQIPAGVNSIAVMPELMHWTIETCKKLGFVGVVTDNLGKE